MTNICKVAITFVFVLFFAFFIRIPINVYGMDNSVEDVFNVLVVNSYEQGNDWEKYILEGLESTIKSENHENNINLNIEYLDIDSKNSEEYIDSVKKMLGAKYPKGKIDAIYVIYDAAYEVFAKEIVNKNSPFYHIPLVFSGVNKKVSISSEQEKHIAGIYSLNHSLNLFTLIKNLNPDVENVNVLLDSSSYCEAIKNEIDKLIKAYFEEDIRINYIKNDYMEYIIDKVEKTNNKENTVNIISGQFKSIYLNKILDPKETVDIIKKHTSEPIYTNNQIYLNAGILGAYIEKGQDLGKLAAKMLLRLEDGESIYNIKSDNSERAATYVDYNSIYKYNISPLNIGESIEVINKKPYQLLAPVWVKISIVFILFVFLFGIVENIYIYRKNKKIEENEKKISKEREKLVTEFIINLSHELRTPINIILNTSKIMEINMSKGTINNDDILDKLQNINQNSYRLLKIANNIIDLTKIEFNMLELHIENCNIVTVVEEIFISSIDIGKKKNIEMVFDTDIEEIITAIDVFQIQRVILNLLSNAIKFTNDGGLILLSISHTSEYIVIEVSDDGVGIKKEKLKYIFDNFYQVDNLLTRKSEGSGIGLSITKYIIEVHNGKIEVESEIDKGSTFRVYIPIKTIKEDEQNNKLKIIDNSKIVELEMSDI